MKILVVNTGITTREGITNVIFNLLEHIPNIDIQFGYVSNNKPSQEFIERLERLNCKLYVIPRSIKNLLSYINSLSKVASEYDIIHVHGNSATLAIDLFAAKLAGVKHRLAHSHNTSCKMVLTDKILRPLFYKLCNGRLACGDAAGKWLYGKRNYKVIQNGINTSNFKFNPIKRSEIRKSLGWEDKLVIGHVGNFVEAKNHKFIFEIVTSAIKKNKDIRLICVGGGRLFKSAKEYLKKNNLQNYICLTDNIPNPEDYLSAMDVILMPSIHEGLPLSLVEEQANGLQCIVSDAITKEVDLTGNIHFLSLNKPIDLWVTILNEIFSISYNRERESNRCIALIKDKGYDISTEARKLYDYYLGLSVKSED